MFAGSVTGTFVRGSINTFVRGSINAERSESEQRGACREAFMASSSVAVTSEDSANSNLAILTAPADSLPGEVREPLSGGASTPLSGGTSTPLSAGASTLSGGRASPETARPSPALVPATARTGAAIRNNRVHRLNVVTQRAAAELTDAVTRYKGVRPNKNNNDDDDNINSNNHAVLAECFQPSTLHKLRQLGFYAKKVMPDDNNIYNNNHAALAERFQPSTLHKLRQLGLYTQHGHTRRQRHQQQQPRGSGGAFPAEYVAQAATSRSLHQHGHARYCVSA